MRWIAALSMLAIFGGVPATAQERQAKPFEGTSVTLIAGADGANRYGDWSGGIVYGGQLGHDWQRNRLVFGLEGEVTGSSDTRCGHPYSSGSGGVTNCVSTGRDFYAGGRIGTPIGNTTLLYGKMGYTNVEQQYSSPQFLSGTTDGFRLGTGVEHRLTSGMTLKAEYRYSNYAGSYDRHQAVLGLGFRF